MRFILPCFAIAVLPLFGGGPSLPRSSPAPVTILLDFEHSHSNFPILEMKKELNGILSGSGVLVNLLYKEELSLNSVFGDLLIFRMKGFCDLADMPVDAISDERGPLAMAYQSDGKILSFGAVECDRIRQSLARLFGTDRLQLHSLSFAKAISRVMAHEMYHMLGNSSSHTRNGLTKSSLSARELTEGTAELPDDAGAAVRRHGELQLSAPR